MNFDKIAQRIVRGNYTEIKIKEILEDIYYCGVRDEQQRHNEEPNEFYVTPEYIVIESRINHDKTI